MGSAVETVREPAAFSPGGTGSMYDRPGQNYIAVATVGHADGSSDGWLVVESGQLLVEITYRTGNIGQESRARISAGITFLELAIGEQVLVHMVGGNESHGVIVGTMNSLAQPLPATVAGVATGSAEAPQRGDQAQGPVFTFVRTRKGRLLAFETGEGADLLMHSGAGVEIKGSAIHLDGLVHLGAGFTTPPLPATVTIQDADDTGAGTGVLPGVAGAPHIPTPGFNPTLPEYTGAQDGIVRAKDRYQSNAAIDSTFWAHYTGLEVLLAAVAASPVLVALDPDLVPAFAAFQLLLKPDGLVSAAMTASRCTAGDGPEPAP